MSFCQYCTLKIKLLFYCSLCRNQFCSTNCLINHITKNHSKKIITSKNYSLLNQNDIITKISSNNQGYIINMKPYILTKEEFMNFISEEYYELMARMIVYNPNKRIKLRDVFKSKLYLKFQVPYIHMYHKKLFYFQFHFLHNNQNHII